MIVIRFGGTSLASLASIKRVAFIVFSQVESGEAMLPVIGPALLWFRMVRIESEIVKRL